MPAGCRCPRHAARCCGTDLTIYARALEDLAGLTSRPQPVALDLCVADQHSGHSRARRRLVRHAAAGAGWSRGRTFLLRQLLQFILSRGSLLSLRAAAETGRRSMPTAGLLKAEVAISLSSGSTCVISASRQQGRRAAAVIGGATEIPATSCVGRGEAGVKHALGEGGGEGISPDSEGRRRI